MGVEWLAVVLLGAATPDVARDKWAKQIQRGTPRVDHGFSAGRHLGFYFAGAWEFYDWRHGSLGIGALFATHFHFQRDPRAPQPGVEIRGVDTSVNLAPMLAHTFRFVRQRLHLRFGTYAGISIRNQHTEIEDKAHGFKQRHDFTEPYVDVGGLTSFGVRLGNDYGLNLEAIVPFYVGPDNPAIPAAWSITGPYAGLSLTFYI